MGHWHCHSWAGPSLVSQLLEEEITRHPSKGWNQGMYTQMANIVGNGGDERQRMVKSMPIEE